MREELLHLQPGRAAQAIDHGRQQQRQRHREQPAEAVASQRQLADGVFPPLLLAGLVRHVRQLWQAKTLMSRGVRGRALGGPLEMNPYIAEKLGRASQTFSEAQLHEVFLLLADADYRLKTGQAGPELLEQAVIGLCRREK